MKLEVGMFARIDGKIGKVIQICTCEQCEARGYYEPIIEYAHGERDYVSVYWKDNLKASHNIIDLIEVGDYVNGHQVYEVDRECCRITLNGGDYGDEFRLTYLRPALGKNMGIKSIVTKEQFKSISYEVSK